MAGNSASNNKYIGGAISPGGMAPKLGIHITHTSYYIYYTTASQETARGSRGRGRNRPRSADLTPSVIRSNSRATKPVPPSPCLLYPQKTRCWARKTAIAPQRLHLLRALLDHPKATIEGYILFFGHMTWPGKAGYGLGAAFLKRLALFCVSDQYKTACWNDQGVL